MSDMKEVSMNRDQCIESKPVPVHAMVAVDVMHHTKTENNPKLRNTVFISLTHLEPCLSHHTNQYGTRNHLECSNV